MFFFNPTKKSNCFTRPLSDEEKGVNEDYNVNKCCYVAFNDMEECLAMDSTKIDESKEIFIQAHLNYGYEIKNIEIICDDSSNKPIGESNDSNQDSNVSNQDSNDSNDSNQDSNDSNQETNESFAKIFGISYFTGLSILFV